MSKKQKAIEALELAKIQISPKTMRVFIDTALAHLQAQPDLEAENERLKSLIEQLLFIIESRSEVRQINLDNREDATVELAKQALQAKPCKTCGGEEEIQFPEAKQAWDIPDAPIPTEPCPDCQSKAGEVTPFEKQLMEKLDELIENEQTLCTKLAKRGEVIRRVIGLYSESPWLISEIKHILGDDFDKIIKGKDNGRE